MTGRACPVRCPALLHIPAAQGGWARQHCIALVCTDLRRSLARDCARPEGREHPGLMAEELGLPDEVYGFGSWLLWVLATRAMAVVDWPLRPGLHARRRITAWWKATRSLRRRWSPGCSPPPSPASRPLS
jgi:hypothetical protein